MLPDDKALRLLRLRSLLFSSPLFYLNGTLRQPHNLAAKDAARKFRARIRKHLEEFEWKPPPRAKIWVRLCFDARPESPGLGNLPKYYLDLLTGLAYHDDRQVEALEVTRRQSSDLSREGVLVKLDRLARVRERQRVAEYLLSTVLDGFDYREERSYDPLSIEDQQAVEALVPGYQARRLLEDSGRGLHWYHYPRRDMYPEESARIRETDPLVVELGRLPAHGEGDRYRRGLDSQITSFLRRYPFLAGGGCVPLKLVAQVARSDLGPGKDLDNIMRDVLSVLGPKFPGIDGYRIHAVSRLPGDQAGRLWLWFVPSHYFFSDLDPEAVIRDAIDRL